MKKILCFGLVLQDILLRGVQNLPSHWEDSVTADGAVISAGGGASNSALTIAKLGGAVDLLGRVGGDGAGNAVREELKQNNVGDRLIVTKESSTGIAVGLVHPDGRRCFVVNRGANLYLNKNDFDKIDYSQYGALLINGYFRFPQLEPDMEDILSVFAEKGIVVGFDTAGWDSEEKWFERIKPFAKYIDYFFPNAEQLKKLGKSDNEERCAAYLKNHGVKNVVLKRGENGCTMFSDKEIIHAEGYKVMAADTTGAGDSFDGAFMLGLMKGWNNQRCMRFANIVAAKNCTAVGSTAGVPAFEDATKTLEEKKWH